VKCKSNKPFLILAMAVSGFQPGAAVLPATQLELSVSCR